MASNRRLGTRDQHLERARSLETRARELYMAGVFSEAIVWSFYSAVHYATAYLVAVKNVRFIASHTQRGGYMASDTVLGEAAVYRSYADLQEMSEDARYSVIATSENDCRGGLRRLDAVRDAVLKAI